MSDYVVIFGLVVIGVVVVVFLLKNFDGFKIALGWGGTSVEVTAEKKAKKAGNALLEVGDELSDAKVDIESGEGGDAIAKIKGGVKKTIITIKS